MELSLLCSGVGGVHMSCCNRQTEVEGRMAQVHSPGKGGCRCGGEWKVAGCLVGIQTAELCRYANMQGGVWPEPVAFTMPLLPTMLRSRFATTSLSGI
jgi:hypothetical protein